MDAHFLSVYAREVRAQCLYASQAIDALNFSLEQTRLAGRDYDRREFFHREVFRAIHSFLAHTSNTSRLFWPPLPGRRHNESTSAYEARVSTLDRAKRAAALRQAFSLSDASPLRQRTLRDHLEHFDERLDAWRTTSANRNLVNDMIGPIGSIAGIEPTDMFRWLDPASKCFIFRGESYDIQALATEIARVYEIATTMDRRPCRGAAAGGA